MPEAFVLKPERLALKCGGNRAQESEVSLSLSLMHLVDMQLVDSKMFIHIIH